MMTLRSYLFATSLAGACALHAADDETHFKAHEYTPRKTLDAPSYKAIAYTPAGTSGSTGKTFEEPRATGRWRLLGGGKEVADAQEVHGKVYTDAQSYQQTKNISVPTIKADPKDIPEKKPFVESGKKLADAAYTPAEKPQGKNPLLKPRQGIKGAE